MRKLVAFSLILLGCGSSAAPTDDAQANTTGDESPAEDPAPAGPIAFTGTPDIAAASEGPITGALYGEDATVTVRFAVSGDRWSVSFDSVDGTGYATGQIALDGALATGAHIQSTAGARAGYFCDNTGANRMDTEVAYAIEITDASAEPCPASSEDWTEVGTATGRIVLLAHDPVGGAPDSYLAGSFENVSVACAPTD